jgi:hypothetical protein
MKLPAWLKVWLPMAIVATGSIAFSYIATQQNYRQSANDPQIQLATDGAAALRDGTAPDKIAPDADIDMGKSLAPFTIVVDDQRHVLAAGANLGAQVPLPPAGAFDFAKAHGENRFTWQPQPGVRLAAVLVHTTGDHPGYVLAARNLREVEERESQLTALAALALAAVLGLTLITTILWRK